MHDAGCAGESPTEILQGEQGVGKQANTNAWGRRWGTPANLLFSQAWDGATRSPKMVPTDFTAGLNGSHEVTSLEWGLDTYADIFVRTRIKPVG